MTDFETKLLRSLRLRGAAHAEGVSLKILGNVPQEGKYTFEVTFNGRRHQALDAYDTIEEAQHAAVAAVVAGPREAPVERVAVHQPKVVRRYPRPAVSRPRQPKLLRDMETPTVMGYELNRVTLTPIRHEVPRRSGDYGADPIGDGTFRMVPSGDIVDLTERNRRLER